MLLEPVHVPLRCTASAADATPIGTRQPIPTAVTTANRVMERMRSSGAVERVGCDSFTIRGAARGRHWTIGVRPTGRPEPDPWTPSSGLRAGGHVVVEAG